MSQPSQIKSNKTSVQELLGLIPSHLHTQLVKELKVDQGIEKLKGKWLFDLILYSLFSPIRISLRRMQEHATSSNFSFYSHVALEHVAHTSIRSRLLKINPVYFRELYQHLYDKLLIHYEPRVLLKKFRLKRYDSTMIAVFAHLIEGMRVGNSSKNKRQVKFTTELSGSGLIHMQFFSDQAHLSEETALKEAIEQRTHNSDEIVLFDAGLKGRKNLQSLDLANIQFITRLNTKPRYELCYETPQNFEPIEESLKEQLPQSAPVINDQIVYLAQDGHNWLEHEFRLIQIDIKQEHPLCIVSNINWLAPEIIAAIYLMRWDIEVLFRFLKQEMDFSHFVSYDPNAIEVMMYCSMIAAMLILVYKRKNHINSFKKAKIMFLKELDAFAMLSLIEDDVGIQFLKKQLKSIIVQ